MRFYLFIYFKEFQRRGLLNKEAIHTYSFLERQNTILNIIRITDDAMLAAEGTRGCEQ